ncbi:ribosome biogenesis protein SSF1/2, partial [Tremellales sp. Uapishka_1]
MGKRNRKNRTHLKGPAKGDTEENVPKSFVIKSGVVTKSISQLVRDTRKLMEPNTATRLRERPSARLRDYLSVAPTLNVTHLLAFTLTDAANVHLRVARFPQGPTLTFRVGRYSLMKDLAQSSLRNVGKAPAGEYRNPPLLVLNNFQQPAGSTALPQLRLMSTMFQGLFPPIQVEKVHPISLICVSPSDRPQSALPTFRRVLLLSYSHTTNLISLRHYTISVRPHGVSRRVRKLLTATTLATSTKSRKAPDLSRADDIADYLLKRTGTPGSEASTAGYDSMSETDASEAESDTNAIELPEDYVGRGNRKGERKAVRLVETGPRMELRLIKVVEGLVGSRKGEGETVFHEFVHKSKTDAAKQKKSHEEKRAAKDARRAEQAANVARKQKLKGEAVEGEEEEGEDGEDLDVEGLSDHDPEEDLEEFRRQKAEEGDAEDSEDEDEGEWGEDVGAGDVSEEEEDESSESEVEQRPQKQKRPVGGKKK